MLISSKYQELTNSIEFVLRNPHLYGVSVDRDNMLSIIEVFESILTFKEWFWIIFIEQNLSGSILDARDGASPTANLVPNSPAKCQVALQLLLGATGFFLV